MPRRIVPVWCIDARQRGVVEMSRSRDESEILSVAVRGGLRLDMAFLGMILEDCFYTEGVRINICTVRTMIEER